MTGTEPGPALPSPFVDRLWQPVKSVAGHEISGAVVLLFATVLALLWANSWWSASYAKLVETQVTVAVGSFGISKSLLHWINDGLMGVFFFAVGLEIKRELLAGEFASLRKALLPAVAALGGMAVPALIYLAINYGTATETGWGIPMATDIAFALGVLAVLGKRVPVGLVLFLTGVAIVDDVGAILVIAIVYTDEVSFLSLLVACGGFVLALLANRAGVRNPLVYLLFGIVVWVAFMKSGVHATLAAVLMAFAIPASTRLHGARLLGRVHQSMDALRESGVPADTGLLTSDQHDALGRLFETVELGTAPLQRLEIFLAPFVKFFVLPLFALVNAGVLIGYGTSGVVDSPVVLGVVVGLFIGKPVGILLFSWLAVRMGWVDLPEGVSWRQIHGVGVLAGVGFTMSLFIGGLAFVDPASQHAAKVGILVASLLSAVVGLLLLSTASRSESAGTAEPEIPADSAS